MPTTIDISGQRFERWTVQRFSRRDRAHSYWEVLCDCGGQAVVTMNSLRRGLSQSCGCLMRERTAASNTTHGETRSRDISSEYGTWCAMKNRCYNPSTKSYQNYGARGITVCDEWRDDFAQFLKDMGRRPPGLTIERKDNDGPYAPWNCVWATRNTQARNKRGLLFVTVDGQRMNLVDACAALGLPYHAVHHRILRGWPESRWLEPLR